MITGFPRLVVWVVLITMLCAQFTGFSAGVPAAQADEDQWNPQEALSEQVLPHALKAKIQQTASLLEMLSDAQHNFDVKVLREALESYKTGDVERGDISVTLFLMGHQEKMLKSQGGKHLTEAQRGRFFQFVAGIDPNGVRETTAKSIYILRSLVKVDYQRSIKERGTADTISWRRNQLIRDAVSDLNSALSGFGKFLKSAPVQYSVSFLLHNNDFIQRLDGIREAIINRFATVDDRVADLRYFMSRFKKTKSFHGSTLAERKQDGFKLQQFIEDEGREEVKRIYLYASEEGLVKSASVLALCALAPGAAPVWIATVGAVSMGVVAAKSAVNVSDALIKYGFRGLGDINVIIDVMMVVTATAGSSVIAKNIMSRVPQLAKLMKATRLARGPEAAFQAIDKLVRALQQVSMWGLCAYGTGMGAWTLLHAAQIAKQEGVSVYEVVLDGTINLALGIIGGVKGYRMLKTKISKAGSSANTEAKDIKGEVSAPPKAKTESKPESKTGSRKSSRSKSESKTPATETPVVKTPATREAYEQRKLLNDAHRYADDVLSSGYGSEKFEMGWMIESEYSARTSKAYSRLLEKINHPKYREYFKKQIHRVIELKADAWMKKNKAWTEGVPVAQRPLIMRKMLADLIAENAFKMSMFKRVAIGSIVTILGTSKFIFDLVKGALVAGPAARIMNAATAWAMDPIVNKVYQECQDSMKDYSIIIQMSLEERKRKAEEMNNKMIQVNESLNRVNFEILPLKERERVMFEYKKTYAAYFSYNKALLADTLIQGRSMYISYAIEKPLWIASLMSTAKCSETTAEIRITQLREQLQSEKNEERIAAIKAAIKAQETDIQMNKNMMGMALAAYEVTMFLYSDMVHEKNKSTTDQMDSYLQSGEYLKINEYKSYFHDEMDEALKTINREFRAPHGAVETPQPGRAR